MASSSAPLTCDSPTETTHTLSSVADEGSTESRGVTMPTEQGPLSTAHKHEQKIIKEAVAVDRTPRRWGRSHSPLRQLLGAGSSSRTASPTRSPEVDKITVQDDMICGATTVDSGEKASSMASTSPAELVGSRCTWAGSARRGSFGPEQRVCMKDVSRPMSYDECHLLGGEHDNAGSLDLAPSVLRRSPGNDDGSGGNEAQGETDDECGELGGPGIRHITGDARDGRQHGKRSRGRHQKGA